MVADEAPVVVAGLEHCLKTFKDLVVVGTAFTVSDVLQKCRDTSPHVVFIDYLLPGGGVCSVLADREAKKAHRAFIVLSSVTQSHAIKKSFRAGASAYLLKSDPLGDLPYIIRAVHNGEKYVSQRLSNVVLDHLLGQEQEGVRLTDRQSEILALISRGYTSPEIATELDIRLRTVHTHRARLMKKLDVHTASALVFVAQKAGLL